MSSVLNMLGLYDDGGIKLEFVLPAAVVLVAFVFLLKLSVRKPEPAKNSQTVKKQKITTNKQKEEKSHSDRKEKIIKEKKKLPSPVKPLDTTNETVKSKPIKKLEQVGSEKSPKKSAQTKKQQVATKNNQKNTTSKNNQANKKQLESVIGKEEEGEWQMVTTKKQKQTKQDEPIEATTPTKSKQKLQKSPEKNKIASQAKHINKVANEKNEISSIILNGEITPPEIKEVVKAKTFENAQENHDLTATPVAPVQPQSAVPEIHASGKTAANANSEDKTLQSETKPAANVAFDDLGDHDWTDTKPQKKNRRKPLRE